MITLKQVAEMSGVSPSTVSNIMNGKTNVSEKTKQKVLSIINETGYRPNYMAMGLRKQRTMTIGVIAEDITQFSIPGMIEGITSYCEKHGYRIVFENLRMYRKQSEQSNKLRKKAILDVVPAVQSLLSIKVAGILYVAGHARKIPCFYDDLNVPAVMIYGYTGVPDIQSVQQDDEKGGYEMTKYLVSKGHRRIGVIGGEADNLHTEKRLLGYQKALFEEKILYDPELIRYGNWMRGSGYRQAEPLLLAGVTAVFCFSDVIAGGVYDYLEEHHMRAGEDVSVAGYDNQELSGYLSPGLTTMELPLVKMGQRAAEILINKIEETEGERPTYKEKLLLPCSMVYRNSVKNVKN